MRSAETPVNRFVVFVEALVLEAWWIAMGGEVGRKATAPKNIDEFVHVEKDFIENRLPRHWVRGLTRGPYNA